MRTYKDIKHSPSMNIRNYFFALITIACMFSSVQLFSQMPTCPSPYVYMDGGSFIQFYNPALPLSATNPSNTNIPTFGSGLALMPNITGPSFTPSPTFYTTSGNNYYYWNGSSWVNTGGSTGNSAAVNIAGCGGKIYNLVGSTGQVYVYNGTGNGTLLTTISGFGGGGPYDLVCDCNCNFYLLNTTTPNQSLTLYSSTGGTLCSWSLSGMPNTSAGGGFAIIGNQIYVKNNLTNGFFIGTIGASSVTFTNVTGFSASPGDFASCPVCNSMSVTASNTGTIGCSTPSVNVIATTTASPVTYAWSGPGIIGPTNTSVTAVNQGGVYSCTVSMAGCPPLSTVVTTTVVSNGVVITPSVTISNTLTCAQPSTQLTVTPGPAGYTYTWTGPGLTGPANSQITSANQPGTYTVAVLSTTNTCAGTLTFAVTSNTTPPVVTATPGNTTICAGSSAVLTAAGAVTYTWSNASTTSSITVSPPATQSYTVTGSAANGCTAQAVANVSVIPLPVPSISSNAPVCFGTTLTLNATGGTSYVWMGPNSFSSTVQSPSIAPVSLSASGIYTLYATIGICTASVTSNIVINPLPVPTATNNGPVCDGQATSFGAGGGVSYVWTGPGSFASNSQFPGIPNTGLPAMGIYSVMVTNANGCVNYTTTSLVVNPLPAITVVGSTVCANTNITLSATGGNVFNWSGPGGFTSTQQNPVIPNATVPMTGVYNVTVTNSNGCVNYASTQVFVNPMPTPSATNTGPLCINNVFMLSGTGGLTYQWSGPNGFFSTSQNPTLTATSTGFSGQYTLTASDAIGCLGTAVTTVVVNDVPAVSILATNNQGCVPLCPTFTCSTSSGATITWLFANGVTGTGITSSTCYDIPANYVVTSNVTDANGCSNNSTFTVNAYPIPVADFNYAPIKPIENDDITFTDASYGATIAGWNWYFMSTASQQSTEQNPVFIYTEAGAYAITLIAKSDQGCIDTVTKTILVGQDFGIFVPNAFTPNGDGLNDIFFAKGFGIVSFKMEIFDRWGEKVFTGNNINDAWDGTYQLKGGKIVQDGVFSWRIELTDVYGKSKELTGHVTLIK